MPEPTDKQIVEALMVFFAAQGKHPSRQQILETICDVGLEKLEERKNDTDT